MCHFIAVPLYMYAAIPKTLHACRQFFKLYMYAAMRTALDFYT